jgi:hypothetical protein
MLVMGKPTDIEVFALRQHILKYESRLSSECHARLNFEYGGGKPYMGILEVFYHGTLMFTIDTPSEKRCIFFPRAKLTFDQCCQWMMFNRFTLGFDYLEFKNGWKPWEK